MVIVVLLALALLFGVVFLVRWNLELAEKLEATEIALDGWKVEAAKRNQQISDWEDDKESFDTIKEENDRLKKAASKLIIQVAESFGREVTNPKQAK